jgi:hypothetical protein
MTILNHASDGLYPEMIVLARAAALAGSMAPEELVGLCATDSPVRLRAALSRWTSLGLFHNDGTKVDVAAAFARKRGESIDDWTSRLPHLCRTLALSPLNCLPLWGTSEGITADLGRGLAWLLCQDIFSLPRTWDAVEVLTSTQVRGATLIQNDTRWNGLRFWARYFGFASGGSRSFFVDPTDAVKAVAATFLPEGDSLDAFTFVDELAQRLPVLDGGAYRGEVERQMDGSNWRKPLEGHLSMALSFAIRRLRLDGSLVLEARSDAQRGFTLTCKDYVSGEVFTHVRARGALHEPG